MPGGVDVRGGAGCWCPGIFPGRLRRRCITATMLHLMQRRCAWQEWLMCLVLAATKKTP